VFCHSKKAPFNDIIAYRVLSKYATIFSAIKCGPQLGFQMVTIPGAKEGPTYGKPFSSVSLLLPFSYSILCWQPVPRDAIEARLPREIFTNPSLDAIYSHTDRFVGSGHLKVRRLRQQSALNSSYLYLRYRDS